MEPSSVTSSSLFSRKLSIMEEYREGQRVNLQDLSDEILLSIVEFVGTQIQGSFGIPCYEQHLPKSLLNLMLTSRTLHRIAEPVLYKKFSTPPRPSRPDRRTQLFLCRILARPDLASRVRIFQDIARDDQGPLDMQCVKDEDWVRIQQAIKSGVIPKDRPTDSTWIQDIRQGWWGAITTLIIDLLPNLEVVVFKDWASELEKPGAPRIEGVLQRGPIIQNQPGTLSCAPPNLQTVTIRLNADRSGNDGMDIPSLLRLLKMRTLRCLSGSSGPEEVQHADTENQGLNVYYQPDWLESPPTLTTKEISLWRADVDRWTLTNFLRCFASIEKLLYQDIGRHQGFLNFEPPWMMEAIEHLKPFLQELSVWNDVSIQPMGYEAYPIGSLSGFEKLKSVDMSSCVLIGVAEEQDTEAVFESHQTLIEALPTCIETLSVRKCQQNIVAPMFELLANIDQFTSLKRINLEWEMIVYPDKPNPREPALHPGFTKEEAQKLLALCDAAEVEMTIKPSIQNRGRSTGGRSLSLA